jgi:hypothetical protein
MKPGCFAFSRHGACAGWALYENSKAEPPEIDRIGTDGG